MSDIWTSSTDLDEGDTQVTAVKERPIPSRHFDSFSRSNRILLTLTLIFSIIGALSGAFAIFFYWQSLPAQAEESVYEVTEDEVDVAEIEGIDYITFHDYQLPIYESVAQNEYDVEAFAVADGIISYPDAQLGVDVSQHQGEIDWEAVAADGVTFAMIRLGYRGYGESGAIVLDSYFHENMEGAQAAGLEVGVYFFSQAISVWETLEEAYFVLDNLEGYSIELPVVFDWEFIDYTSTARTHGTSGRSITLYNQVFNQEMELAGYDCMTYFNQNLGYLYLDLEDLSDYPFWLASYRDSPNFYYHFDIWQYTDAGLIDGIEGYVDLNLMFSDVEE